VQIFDPKSTYKTKRHKLFWCDCSINSITSLFPIFNKLNISYINIGFELSKFIQSQKKDKFLGINSADFLRNLLIEKATLSINVAHPTVAILNLGILFEPTLSLDPLSFIRELSKEVSIILLWENIVINDNIFQWDNNNEYKLDFSGTLITKINFNNEI
jgi:hypothetical protein